MTSEAISSVDRDMEAETRHLWNWVRENSSLRDLPEMAWNSYGEFLACNDRGDGARVSFEVEVIHHSIKGRREIAITTVRGKTWSASERMTIPPDVSEAALALSRR
jgi:hypothetical protein